MKILVEKTHNGSFCDMFNNETGGHVYIDRLIPAYSRHKSLRDKLYPSTLTETDDINVQVFPPVP